MLRLKAFGLEFVPLAFLILQSLDLVKNYMSVLLVLQFADCSYQTLIGSFQTLIEKPIPNNKVYRHTHTHTHTHFYPPIGLLRWLSDKEYTCQGKGCRRCVFYLWVWKISWGRKWQQSPVFLLEKSHRQRSVVGYSPWSCKEMDMTELLSAHTHTSYYWFYFSGESLSDTDGIPHFDFLSSPTCSMKI